MTTKLTKNEMIAFILESKMMCGSDGKPLENLDYMKKYLKKDVERLYKKAVAYSNR